MTDEKLAECSAEATGVYIRLMCLMHKSEQYGTILLKQKSKQNSKQIVNFALQVAKHLPYTYNIVEAAMIELLDEGVIQIEGDVLLQKRMVKDNRVSEARKQAGEKGGKKTQSINKNFALAKSEANTENENEIVNESIVVVNNVNAKFKKMLLESESVIGSVCFALKISNADAEHLRDIFTMQAEATNEHHNNYSDYSKHFINWAKLNKGLLTEKKSKTATTITVAERIRKNLENAE
jgi:hypothetical protein